MFLLLEYGARDWVIPFFIRTPPMEGKIPTGLFMPNQIPTPLDVAISYFRYPLTSLCIINAQNIVQPKLRYYERLTKDKQKRRKFLTI